MADFVSQSSIDNFFTIGKVAFGQTDYIELSAYFLVIAGIVLAVYFQLFCAGDSSVVEKVFSPVKVAPVREVTEVIQETKNTKKRAGKEGT
jgi:hypothetical protein